MKNLLFVFAIIASTLSLNAQANLKVEKVDPAEVPQAVLDAQAKYFPGITVNIWEKQSASLRDKSGSRYVANFQNEGQKNRARYYSNGTAGTATIYYVAKELPQAIQNAASNNYPDYMLMSGEQITVLAKDKSAFRIRLRKGARKLVVYADENGNELSKDNLPVEMTEE